MEPVNPAAASVDYLDEDIFTPNGQRFCLVSFIGPELRQKNDKFGMKVRGCFATKEEAAAYVKKLQSVDGSVDIFMLEVGKWCLIPPQASDIEDVEYQEQYLNDLMKDYRDSQAKAKEYFQQRTAAVKSEGLDNHLLEEERLPPPEEEITASDVLKSIENTPSGSGGV